MFELAKNFIVEGLTHKLGTKDKTPLGQKLDININPRVYYDERMIIGGAASSQPEARPINKNIQNLFDQAVEQRQKMPVSMNIGKLYQSQEERIQDELNQAKADALRRNVLGGSMQNMIKQGGQTNTPGNPLGKLFGGLGKGTPAGVPAMSQSIA